MLQQSEQRLRSVAGMMKFLRPGIVLPAAALVGK
jgi:hypothetical protein